ncbi:MAG: competence/damage-inducible protein A [Thermoanaerobaculia bacterium]
MRATILAVGSELLSTDRLDTNSLRLTGMLEEYGVELVRKVVVGDLEDEIATEIAALWDAGELLLVSGGLGPTADDVTREGAARALGVQLTEDPAVIEAIAARFASFGRPVSENNRKQAQVLAGGRALANPHGTAPGQIFERGGRALFLFPGVPHELDYLAAEHLRPWLAARSGGVAVEAVTMKVAMRPESEIDQKLVPVYERFGREAIGVLASPGEIRIVLKASGPESGRKTQLAAMREAVREAIGDSLFGEGAATLLEQVVGELLRRAGLAVAVAESCTGGLLAARLTSVPGASAWFPGGVVSYANERKVEWLGVPERLLAEHGAVSEPVARAMAEGIRDATGADFGVGITGVAGPDGGSEAKPVGTVHVALARPDGDTVHRMARFLGDRERTRLFATQMALETLRRELVRREREE